MNPHISPRQLSQAIGVSESSIKRWIDTGRIPAVRTAGGHRRIAVPEAARFIRESGMPVLKPQILGLSTSLPAGQVDLSSLTQEFKAGLLAGDEARIRGILESEYLSGRSLAEIADHLVAPVMSDIGALWQHDHKGIYLEHRATQICIQALNGVRRLMPDPPRNAPVAVGAAPSGDPYLLPSLLAALALLESGWRVQNMGPETPLDSLELAAEESGASLVWLTVSNDQPDIEKRIRQLAATLKNLNAELVVGGRGLSISAATLAGVAHLGTSMSELRSYASGLGAANV